MESLNSWFHFQVKSCGKWRHHDIIWYVSQCRTAEVLFLCPWDRRVGLNCDGPGLRCGNQDSRHRMKFWALKCWCSASEYTLTSGGWDGTWETHATLRQASHQYICINHQFHQWQCQTFRKIQGLATGTSWRWKAWCRSTSNIAFPKEDVWNPALILHGLLAALHCVFVLIRDMSRLYHHYIIIPFWSHLMFICFMLFHLFHLTDTRRWIRKHYPECPASRRRWWQPF